MSYVPSGNKNGQIKEFNLLLPCFMCISKRIFDVPPLALPFSEATPCHHPPPQNLPGIFQSTSDLISRVLCLQPMINDHRSGEMCLHPNAAAMVLLQQPGERPGRKRPEEVYRCLLAGVEKNELNLTCNGRVLQSRTGCGWRGDHSSGIIEAKSFARGQASN